MKFNPNNAIGFLMRQAFGATKARVQQKLRQSNSDITMEQGGVLMRLWMNDGQQQGDLAASLNKDKTTIARIISNMEKSSLVVRVPDKTDKRVNLVYLTEKGREQQQKVAVSLAQTFKEAEAGISEEDMEITKETLRKIYKNMEGLTNEEGFSC